MRMNADWELAIRPEYAARIVWGKPESPQRDLCAICHGGLPEVPIRMWKADGSGAALCDTCVEKALMKVRSSQR
jgi:hypothetical protein